MVGRVDRALGHTREDLIGCSCALDASNGRAAAHLPVAVFGRHVRAFRCLLPSSALAFNSSAVRHSSERLSGLTIVNSGGESPG